MAKTEGAKESTAKKKTFKKRGEKRVVHHGYAHIQASFNNTLITITDTEGNVVSWSSAGAIGFKGSRKGTPFAATQAAMTAGNVAKTFGMRSVEVLVKGPGPAANPPSARCRTPASRCKSIRDVTPDSAQRLPAPEAPPRRKLTRSLDLERRTTLHGSIYRSGLPPVPPRGHEAVPQGRALLHREVRHREAQHAARPARPPAQAKMSGYGVQLREKQKVKRIYGVLEDQFRRYFEKADRTRGITGEKLLQLLERRLDNAVYRMGFATSRAQARQLVRHGHFLVNGKKVNIPSYSLKPGEVVIGARPQPGKRRPSCTPSARSRAAAFPTGSRSKATLGAKVVSLPTREQINLPVQEQLIVELYSK